MVKMWAFIIWTLKWRLKKRLKKVNWNPFFWCFKSLFLSLNGDSGFCLFFNSTEFNTISFSIFCIFLLFEWQEANNTQQKDKHISLRTYISLYRLYHIKIRLILSFLYQFSRENTQFSFILMWELLLQRLFL